MKKAIVLILLFVTSCAYSRVLYMDENGQTVYEASCNGSALSLGDCYMKAKEDCPFGFDVKDKVSSEWVGARNLVYVCKKNNYQSRPAQNISNQYYRYR
ncbi:MAG: hypothetical protein IKW58_03170 [Alphaproteobacteria bacterium]|nr:hypothetical protein [Alphaproteobacteria bacterium]